MVNTLRPPTSVIASWPKPNYVDPPTRGPALEYLCIIFSALAAAIVTARIYSRLFITRAPGWDDLLVVLALGFAIALAVLVIIGNRLYFSGRHTWDVPIHVFTSARLNVWISMWCYISAATLVKISVLLFYRRLSVKFSRMFLIATWVGIAYNVLYFLGFALSLVFICAPVYAYWKSFDPIWAAFHKYRCDAEGVSLPASAAFSVLGDLYSTLLPVLLIYNLDLPRKQKLALYSLFALGFLAVCAGIVRTVILYRMLNKDYDFMWLLWDVWIWGIVEIFVAILAASAPALKPFFRRYFVDSIGNIARSSKRRAPGRYTPAESKATWVSTASKETGVVDIERIGVAVGGSEPEDRERGFLRDIEQEDTRHFELRASRDGKIIPMQVYKRSTSDDGDEPSNSNPTPPTEDWPMPPATRQADEKYQWSMGSQQPIHVGLQVRQLPPPVGANSRGGVTVSELPAYSSRKTSRERGRDLTPRGFRDMHDDLAAGSRLESPSDSDEALVDDTERPPWRIRQRERSDSDDSRSLNLPRMGSRDFDVEKKRGFQ